jgi:hypothetical protein
MEKPRTQNTEPKVVQAPEDAEAPKPKADTPPATKPLPEKVAAKVEGKTATNSTESSSVMPPVADIPYGNAVPGRPGLVTSPYAGALQLVDVTGLAPGLEVKCPYSGRLFRVPAAQEAANKAGTDEKKKP